MCGVVAQLNFKKTRSSLQLQENMNCALGLLAHRGPDFSNQYWSKDFICGLGHTRLSIQDLSDASHQPFHFDKLVLSFNGEIYNFREIRRELQVQGYQFTTSGDTEVLLLAYHKWRERCFEKFNGMWAIAIWDEATRTLIVSRDRLGVKPLYFRHDERGFTCASEIGALAPYMTGEAQFNQAYLDLALQPGTVAESLPDTLLQEVSKFPPGHYAQIDFQSGTVDLQRWWYPENSDVVAVGDFQQRTEQFRELFEDALAIRNISDAKVAIALSGGLDSGAVAASMLHPFKAFTCDFKESISEAKDASLIMKLLKGEHQLVPCAHPGLKHMLRCTINLEDVSCDSHVGLDLIYQQMSQQGIKVSIEGHGGDEILAGYHHYHLCNLVAKLDQSRSPTSAFSVMRDFCRSTEEQVGKTLLEGLLYNRPQADNVAELTGGRIAQLGVTQLAYPIGSTQSHQSILQTRLYNDLLFNTLPAILRNFDKLSMRHGIEIRSPFLDYRLIQFCQSLPNEDLIHNGFTKWILRKSMSGLPDEIRYQKRKLGFVSPFIAWCQAVEENEWRWLQNLLEAVPEPFVVQELQHVVHSVTVTRNFHHIRRHWARICAALFFARFTGRIQDADLY